MKNTKEIKSTIMMIVDLNTRIVSINQHSKLCTFITDDVEMFISMLNDEFGCLPENVMCMTTNELNKWYEKSTT